MKKQITDLNIHVIRGKRSLTNKEEQAISAYLRSKKSKKKTTPVSKKSAGKSA
ncbi:MAG: hypothetical protein WBP58_18430 [Chitinophagaceae bacterium]